MSPETLEAIEELEAAVAADAVGSYFAAELRRDARTPSRVLAACDTSRAEQWARLKMARRALAAAIQKETRP